MKARREGYTQVVAAAKAGISERSGRNIEHGKRRDPQRMERWRSCPDPLIAVWESELKPMLEQAPALTAITLLEHLQDKYPDAYPDSLLVSVQRSTSCYFADIFYNFGD